MHSEQLKALGLFRWESEGCEKLPAVFSYLTGLGVTAKTKPSSSQRCLHCVGDNREVTASVVQISLSL